MLDGKWDRVKSLFNNLVTLDPTARIDRLKTLQDDEIATELRALLDHHALAGSHFLVSNDEPQPPVKNERKCSFAAGDVIADRFSIVKLIGEGGMGEVYEAIDLMRNRRVAVKCITREAALDERTAQLFRREIESALRITDRNVCRVYDPFFDRKDGQETPILSMELLEGETLQKRLARRGPLPLAEAEPLVRQLLSGLMAAHRAGIVHRDLKPGNLMLVRDDEQGKERLVIMDFGLARTRVRPELEVSVVGGIAGTLEYMAPEQVLGESGPASDIYATGLIVYEILIGSKPFEGDPLMQALRRLIDPPRRPRAAVPNFPVLWEQLILRCLERDPAARFSSADEVLEFLDKGRANDRVRFRRPRHRHLVNAALGVAMILALVYITMSRQFRPNQPLSVSLAPVTTGGGLTTNSAISPDGEWIAYGSDRESQSNLQLWVQKTGDEESRRRLTTDAFDVSAPSFSPDAKHLVFRWERDGGGLYRTQVSVGSPELIARDAITGRYSPDGKWLAYWVGEDSEHPVVPEAIYLMSASGGPARRLASEFYAARRPVWLKDGRHLLFEGIKDSTQNYDNEAGFYVLDVFTGQLYPTGIFELLRQKKLRVYNNPGNFVGDSVFLAARSESAANVYSCKLDRANFRVNGGLNQITFATTLLTFPSLSESGLLLAAGVSANLNVWEFPMRNGAPETAAKITNSLQYDTHPTASRDGSIVAFARTLGRERQIWIKDRQGEHTLVSSPAEKFWPVIKPDGSEVAFAATAGQRESLYKSRVVDRKTELLCDSCGYPTGWSDSGRFLLTMFGSPKQVGVFDLDARRIKARGSRNGDLAEAQFSPGDGFAAFRESLSETRSRLALLRFDAGTGELAGSPIPLTDGSTWDDKPHWSRDGKTIYFVSTRDGFSCLWSLRVNRERIGSMGQPQPLKHFHSHTYSIGEVSHTAFNFDLAEDRMVLNAAEMRGNLWMGQLSGLQ